MHRVAGPDAQLVHARDLGVTEGGRDENVGRGESVVEPVDGRQSELAGLGHVERPRRHDHEQTGRELREVAAQDGVTG